MCFCFFCVFYVSFVWFVSLLWIKKASVNVGVFCVSFVSLLCLFCVSFMSLLCLFCVSFVSVSVCFMCLYVDTKLAKAQKSRVSSAIPLSPLLFFVSFSFFPVHVNLCAIFSLSLSRSRTHTHMHTHTCTHTHTHTYRGVEEVVTVAN